MNKRIKAEVTAHHNVEDFRPYTFTFKDRGNFGQNIGQALALAIKREGNWYGWFDVGGELDGKLSIILNRAQHIFKGDGKNVYIETSNNEELAENCVALVVWCERDGDKWNAGFGMSVSSFQHDRSIESYESGLDKYENKWVTLVG